MTTYEKIDKKNYKQITEEIVNIDFLESRILELQNKLDDTNYLKTVPDVECMEFYNTHMEAMHNKLGIEQELKVKKDKLANIIESSLKVKT